MLNEKESEKIRKLIERAFEEEDETLRDSLADEILSADPNNPVAKFIKWENLDEEESLKNLAMLEEAFESLRATVDDLPSDSEEFETCQALLVTMLSNLASCEYFNGDKEKALEFAEEFMNLDDEGYVVGRVIYYALLIEMKKYEEAIEAADTDLCETPISEHARAIALFETQGPGQDASDSVLEAIMLDPDMAFFVLGLWEFDEESQESFDDEDTDDLMMQVAVLTDLWGATEERLAFLGAIVFAFGYLTGRIEEQEDISMLEEGYKSLGCLDEMISAKQAVETLIAENREPGEIDEEALSLLRELIELGIFN